MTKSGCLFLLYVIVVLLWAASAGLSFFGFRESIWRLELSVAVAFIVAMLSIIDSLSVNRPGRALVFLTAMIGFEISFFAKIFSVTGVKVGDVIVHDFQTTLYFSIVTWTTLGYGDMVAPPEARLIAASEALIGLTFMGVYVAVATIFLQRLSADERHMDDSPRNEAVK